MKRTFITVVTCGVLALAFVLILRACAPTGAGTTPTTSPSAVSSPTSVESSSPESVAPTPAQSARPVAPASFVMPDFIAQDENEVDSWMWTHGIVVSTTFDYGDDEGTSCEENGEGVVDTQTPKAGTTLSNKATVDLTFDVSCG